jgi:hypothetical protein
LAIRAGYEATQYQPVVDDEQRRQYIERVRAELDRR